MPTWRAVLASLELGLPLLQDRPDRFAAVLALESAGGERKLFAEVILEVLEKADLDLVVIDYSSDGSEDGEFSHAEIKSLRDAGKTVLAYFSIGEAEDYRFYWGKKWRVGRPGFIAEENPDWEGNYKAMPWIKSS